MVQKVTGYLTRRGNFHQTEEEANFEEALLDMKQAVETYFQSTTVIKPTDILAFVRQQGQVLTTLYQADIALNIHSPEEKEELNKEIIFTHRGKKNGDQEQDTTKDEDEERVNE